MQQREHRLDIDQALLDLAIDHAHEIQRQIKLHEDRVDHHEVADGEHPTRDIARREQHADDRAEREDHRLPGIQHAERGIGTDRRLLVARHRGIEAPRLELLIAEIFHRLVVEQAVDRLRMRLGVGFVHVAADGDAPLAGPEGEPDIDADGEQHDHHIDPAEIPGDQTRDHRELDRRGDRVQHRHAHDSVDAVDAALDDAAQASGAALQMKAQRKLMQMPEGAVGELAHGVLGNHGEPHVAELREQHHQHAAHAIGDDQHGGDGGEAERREPGDFARARLAGEEVDDRLVGDRHGERDRLGDHERQKREHHPHAEIGAIGRPDIRRKLAQHAQLPRPCLKHGVASRLRQPVLHERSLLFGRTRPPGKKGSEHAAHP